MSRTLPPALRVIASVCALALAAACAPRPAAVRNGIVMASPPAATALTPMTWTPESPVGEVVAWLRQGCGRPAEGKAACVERGLARLLGQAGVARTMAVLDTLAAADAEVAANAHPLAHGIGISAYRSPETMAATFAACPVSQMAGCQHGVIQGYFLELAGQGREPGTAELDAVCAPHRPVYYTFHQCAHGLGHGVMAAYGNHLPRALAACDRASDPQVQRACHGGAFMENVVHVLHPHNTAAGHATTLGGPAAHGAGHAHAGHGAQHGAWKALDPADPHYPCNAVDARYGDACYDLQPSAMMFFAGGDVAATARACEGAPRGLVATCFVSLGREVTSWAGMDHARALEGCRSAGAEGARPRLWCQLGALGTVMSQGADPGEGLRFCRAVQGAEGKRECYRAVGEFVAMVVDGTHARGRHCQGAEAQFVATCRRGAGIDPSPVRDRR